MAAVPSALRRLLLTVLVGVLVLGAALVLGGCQPDGAPPLVEVSELSPRQIELGDRVELRGAGLPQGRPARISFRGTLYRPGAAPVRGATLEAEGVVVTPERVELVFDDALEERFCGRGDRAIHTTFEGTVEVAFASSAPGAPPLVGALRGVSLDVRPSSVRSSVADDRAAEGARVLAFLGMAAGAPSPRGLPIEKIEAGSPADRAGIQVGDVLAAVDGVHVEHIADVIPASTRTTTLVIRSGELGATETKSLSMIGFAGERVPTELAGALLLVGLALAALLLLATPGPAALGVLELRIATRVRRSSLRRMFTALFGTGHDVFVSAALSALLGTFALGPHVLGPEVDGLALLLAAAALLVGSRVVGARGVWQALRLALDVGALVAAMAASLASVVAWSGAMQLGELVRAQGSAPWEMNAVRTPASALLALVYAAAVVTILRLRDEAPPLPDAHGEAPRHPWSARTLERAGLLLASALAAAVFLGGWQLPTGVEPRSLPLQLVAAGLFLVKTWAVAALLAGAAQVASPRGSRAARAFAVKRLLPTLGLALTLVLAERYVAPGVAVERAFAAVALAATTLVVVRGVLRVRGALARPEPQVSPFL